MFKTSEVSAFIMFANILDKTIHVMIPDFSGGEINYLWMDGVAKGPA